MIAPQWRCGLLLIRVDGGKVLFYEAAEPALRLLAEIGRDELEADPDYAPPGQASAQEFVAAALRAVAVGGHGRLQIQRTQLGRRAELTADRRGYLLISLGGGVASPPATPPAAPKARPSAR